MQKDKKNNKIFQGKNINFLQKKEKLKKKMTKKNCWKNFSTEKLQMLNSNV